MKLRHVFHCLFVAVLLGEAATAQAQTKLPPRRTGGVAPRPRMVATGVGLKDGLTMQKGRVVLTELGVTNPLTADKKLINGVRISPTGLVTAKDSSTIQMAEGDVVSLTGRVTSRASIAEADSLLKIKTFDMRYPGKRKKMEEERARKEKVKIKLAEDKAKAKAKRDK
ncbi:DUF6799 domain-containing protein [Hymenobacter sp.]|uniref:DUF6799 domain-containing protein n=1 Tax=Hymenobacter sp. TaxID=1898978 RepID=UPI00286CC044|nr:DUF6799 domain-containing protein [Hymenobacter sp.]